MFDIKRCRNDTEWIVVSRNIYEMQQDSLFKWMIDITILSLWFELTWTLFESRAVKASIHTENFQGSIITQNNI